MNVELFIDLVKQRPCLYDAKDKLNRCKKEKDINWKEIASILNVTDEVARSKWRNLKDTYSKHLKSKRWPTGHASSKYLNWQWASHMEFMKQHLCLALADDLDTQSQSSSDQQLLEVSCEGTLVTNQRSHDGKSVSLPRRRCAFVSRPERNSCPNTNGILQYIDNDATELIFLGYAKTIKSFSIRRQAHIKMRIARIMMEEEVAHFEESVYGNPDCCRSSSPQYHQRSSNYSPSPQHNQQLSNFSPSPQHNQQSSNYSPSQDEVPAMVWRGSAPGASAGESFCPDLKIER